MTFKKIAGLFTAAMMIANASALVPVSAESDEDETILHDTEIESGRWHGLLSIAVSASGYPTDFDDSDFE